MTPEVSKNEKPNPEQYARVVLWHLCMLQASLTEIHTRAIRESGKASGASDYEILTETAKFGNYLYRSAKPLYLDALKQSNIKPSPTYPPQKGD